MTKRRAFLAAIVTGCLLSMAGSIIGEEAEEAGGARVGPDMAVLAANEKDGMRLSEAAIRRLGLSFLSVKAAEVQTVPVKSLVFFRDEAGVYRVRGGWFKLIEVEVVAKSPREVRIRASGFKPGDRIVVEGAPYLRAAELDIIGAEKEEEDERKN